MQDVIDKINNALADVEDKPSQGYYFWLEAFVAEMQPKLVIELGTYRGDSAIYLLKGLPADSKLISVDTTRHKFPRIEDERIVYLIGDDLSEYIWERIPNGIDFIFIDTEHSKEQFFQELTLYTKKFSSTCYVAIDDIYLEGMEGVWDSITYPKYDLSQWHGSGFGLVVIS